MASSNTLPDSNPYPRSPRSRTSSIRRSRRNSLLGHAEPAPSSIQTTSTHSYSHRELSSDQTRIQSLNSPTVEITPPVSLSPESTTWDSPMAARERKNSDVSLGSSKKGHPMLMAALGAAKAPFERRRSMSGSSVEGPSPSKPAKVTLLDAQQKDDAEQKKIDEKAARKLQKSQSSRISRRLSIGGAGSDSEASQSDSGKPKRFNSLTRVFSYRKKKNGDQTNGDGTSSVRSNSSSNVQVEATESTAVVANQEESGDGLMSPVEEESTRAISPALADVFTSSKQTPGEDGAFNLESPLSSPAPGAQFNDVSLTAYAGAAAENKNLDMGETKEMPGGSSAFSQGSWVHVPGDDVAASSTQELREGKTTLQVIDDDEDEGSYADEEGSVLGHSTQGPSLLSSMKERARSMSPGPKGEVRSASPMRGESPSRKGKEVIRTAPPTDFTPPMTPASTKFPDTESKSFTGSGRAVGGASGSSGAEKSAAPGIFSHPLLSRFTGEKKEDEGEKKTADSSSWMPGMPGNVEFSNYVPSRDTVDTAAQYATQNRQKVDGSRADNTRRQSSVSANNNPRRVSIVTTTTSTSQKGLAPPISLRHSQSQPLRSHSSEYGNLYHGSRSSTAPEPTAEDLYPPYPSYRQRAESKASSFSSTVTAAELARRAAASPHHRALLSSPPSSDNITLPFVPSWVPVPYVVVWSWQAFSFTVESALGVAIMGASIATSAVGFVVGLQLGVVRFGLSTMSRAAGAMRRAVGL